jgi:hypothetical protein
MCGIVGRQVYREPGRYSRSDETPVLDGEDHHRGRACG